MLAGAREFEWVRPTLITDKFRAFLSVPGVNLAVAPLSDPRTLRARPESNRRQLPRLAASRDAGKRQGIVWRYAEQLASQQSRQRQRRDIADQYTK